MPYLTKNRQKELYSREFSNVNTPGDLNFVFSEIIKTYLYNKTINYQAYNDVIGALEACKLELYRRMVAPYEDIKIQENGDIYES